MSRSRHRVIQHDELNRVRPRAYRRRLDDRPVAPEGSPHAPLYLVGEAPGTVGGGDRPAVCGSCGGGAARHDARSWNRYVAGQAC
jgi:hypothetical protein